MALATFKSEGPTIDYTPGADVPAGTIVLLGAGTVGVAANFIPANTLGSLRIGGVFEMPKTAGGSTAIAAGDNVYWDNSGGVVTETVGSNTRIGKCVKAAADGDTVVQVWLNQA